MASRSKRSTKVFLDYIIKHDGTAFILIGRLGQLDSCRQGSKSYLNKLNRRSAFIFESRAVESEELSTVFGWPHLQALFNFLVYQCNGTSLSTE